MSFVIAPPAQAVIPIADEPNLYFPVNRIFGVALNYPVTGQPDPEPFFFSRGIDTLYVVPEGREAVLTMPAWTKMLKHEIELVVALKKGGRNLTHEEALACVYGVAAGIDWTVFDQKYPNGSLDWLKAKNFPRSSMMTPLKPIERTPFPEPLGLWLYCNQQKRQDGTTGKLLWSVLDQIVRLSQIWELVPGDILFSGTPEGNLAVTPGDRIEAGVHGVGTLKVRIEAQA